MDNIGSIDEPTVPPRSTTRQLFKSSQALGENAELVNEEWNV